MKINNKPILIEYLDGLKEMEHLQKLKYKYGRDDRIAWLKNRTDELYKYFLKGQIQPYSSFASVFDTNKTYRSYTYRNKYHIMNELSRLTGKEVLLDSEGITIF